MNAVNNACAVKYPPDSADMKYDKLSNVPGQKDANDYSNRLGNIVFHDYEFSGLCI